MKKPAPDIIRTVARVMADSFMEDPLNQAVFDGVEKKDELIHVHTVSHARHAVNSGSLCLLDGNPKAFLIGFDSKDERWWREMALVFKIYLKTFKTLGIKDFKKIIANNKKTKEILSFDWHREFVAGRHYRVKIIAIDKDMRGTGAFRRLITPAIEFCDAQRIPMVLETHNPDNVGLYAHFGFELVKTIASEGINVKQYCMIRRPL